MIRAESEYLKNILRKVKKEEKLVLYIIVKKNTHQLVNMHTHPIMYIQDSGKCGITEKEMISHVKIS